MDDPVSKIRQTLQRFQDGYTLRDVSRLDKFMEVFLPDDEVELIGIGASTRNQNEWFQGLVRIREIVESDWLYWGDVRLDVEHARITVQGEVAWLSTVGGILQTDFVHSDEVTGFALDSMKELLENQNLSPRERLMEVTHYGMRRLRERDKKAGYRWPFVFTAVLVKRGSQWFFHTIHWSMPVE
jgi:hypothetical protein